MVYVPTTLSSDSQACLSACQNTFPCSPETFPKSKPVWCSPHEHVHHWFSPECGYICSPLSTKDAFCTVDLFGSCWVYTGIMVSNAGDGTPWVWFLTRCTAYFQLSPKRYETHTDLCKSLLSEDGKAYGSYPA